MSKETPIDARTWIYVGVAAVVLLALVVAILIVAVLRFRGNRRYAALTHSDYMKEIAEQGDDVHSIEEEEDATGGVRLTRYTDKPSSLLTDDSGDAAQIRLDDNDSDVTTRAEAKAKQSSLLMQEVNLDSKK